MAIDPKFKVGGAGVTDFSGITEPTITEPAIQDFDSPRQTREDLVPGATERRADELKEKSYDASLSPEERQAAALGADAAQNHDDMAKVERTNHALMSARAQLESVRSTISDPGVRAQLDAAIQQLNGLTVTTAAQADFAAPVIADSLAVGNNAEATQFQQDAMGAVAAVTGFAVAAGGAAAALGSSFVGSFGGMAALGGLADKFKDNPEMQGLAATFTQLLSKGAELAGQEKIVVQSTQQGQLAMLNEMSNPNLSLPNQAAGRGAALGA